MNKFILILIFAAIGSGAVVKHRDHPQYFHKIVKMDTLPESTNPLNIVVQDSSDSTLRKLRYTKPQAVCVPSFDSLVSFCALNPTAKRGIAICDTWNITSDYIVPVNINIANVTEDAWITTSSDDSIHITTFSYSGKNHFIDTVDTIVSFGPGIAISPYWFGAVDDWNGTTGTDNTKYLNMTFESAYRSGPNSKVLLGSGYYRVSGILRVSCVVEGVDRGHVRPSDFYGSIQYNHDPYNWQITTGTTIIWDNETLSDTDTYVIPRPVSPDYLRGKFKDMKFMSMTTDTAGGYGTGGGILFRYGAQSNAQTGRDYGFTDPSAFENLWIANFAIGIYIDQSFYTNVDNVGFRGCRTCITIGGYGGSTINQFSECTFEGCGDSLHPFIDLRTTYTTIFRNTNSQGTSWISAGHCNGATIFDGWYFEGQKNFFDSAMIKVADTVEYGLDKRISLCISGVNAPTGTSGDIDLRGMASSLITLQNVSMAASKIIGDENTQLDKFGSDVSTGSVMGILRKNDHTGQFSTASFGDNITPGAKFGSNDRQGISFYRAYLNNGTMIRLNNQARSADSFSFTMPSPAAPDLDSLYVLYAAAKGSALELNDVFIHTTGDDCADGSLLALKISALAAGDRFRIIQDSPQLQLRYGDGNDLRMIIAFGSEYSSAYGAYIDGRGINYPKSVDYDPYGSGGEGGDITIGAAASNRIRFRVSNANFVFEGGKLRRGYTLIDTNNIESQKWKLTEWGGRAIKVVNQTGGVSQIGHLVSPSPSSDTACTLTTQNRPDCMGVMIEDGVAIGDEMWVVESGIAFVYITSACTSGQRARTFITGEAGYVAGRAVAENDTSVTFATDDYYTEVGQIVQSRLSQGLTLVNLNLNSKGTGDSVITGGLHVTGTSRFDGNIYSYYIDNETTVESEFLAARNSLFTGDGATNTFLADTTQAILKVAGDTVFKVNADSVWHDYGIVAGSSASNSRLLSDSGLILTGGATQWKDIQFAIGTGRVPASNAPTWAAFGSYHSKYRFDIGDYVDLQDAEVYHGFCEESDSVEFHVHAFNNGVDITDRTVAGRLYYSFTGVNEQFDNGVDSIDFEGTIPASTSDRTHLYIDAGSISVSDYGIDAGDAITLRIKRIASSGTEPTGDPFFGMVGIHVEVKSLGSVDEVP